MEIFNYVNPDINPSLRVQDTLDGKLTFVGPCMGSEADIAVAAQHAQDSNDILSLTNLAGSYSGIWQTSEATTVFSDLAGQFPVYYRRTDKGLAISESSYQLATMGEKELDRTSLAARLCFHMEYPNEGYTMFEGVRRLPAAHELRIDNQGTVVQRAYDTLMSKAGVDFAIAAEQTRDSLVSAIQHRLDTPRLTSDFSGGHDSTSLAMLAASLGGSPVPSFIHHSEAWPSGDIEHARRLAALHEGIMLEELVVKEADLLHSVITNRSLPFIEDEPFKGLQTLGQALRRVEALREYKSTLHLTGLGGDVLFDGIPSLAELIRRGEGEEAERRALILGRLSLKEPDELMKIAREQSAVDLPTAFAMLADVCRDPSTLPSFTTDWLWRPQANNLDWLTPEMRRLVAERIEKRGDHVDGGVSANAFKTIIGIQGDAQAQRHARYLGGDIFHAPFLDNDVIRSVTQLDLTERVPLGTFKLLLRAALAGHGVPSEVFERTTKGNYSQVFHVGQRQAIPEILRLLDDSYLAAMGIIDPYAIRRSIETYGLDHKRYRLAPFVTAESWLRSHDLTLTKDVSELGIATVTKEHPPLTPEISNALSGNYCITADVVFAAGPDQMVVLNTRSGEHGALNPEAVRVLRAINEDTLGHTVQDIIEHHSTVDPVRIRADVARTILGFIRMGVIKEAGNDKLAPTYLPDLPTPTKTPNVANVRVRQLQPIEKYDFSEGEIALGRQALNQASDLSEQGLADTIKFLQSQWEAATHFSSYGDSERDKVLIQRLATDVNHNKQRIACYESSLAAVLLAAQRGQRVEWNIGVAFRPERKLHAWIEINDKPVLISTDDSLEGFQRLLKI